MSARFPRRGVTARTLSADNGGGSERTAVGTALVCSPPPLTRPQLLCLPRAFLMLNVALCLHPSVGVLCPLLLLPLPLLAFGRAGGFGGGSGKRELLPGRGRDAEIADWCESVRGLFFLFFFLFRSCVCVYVFFFKC